jgi:hypothetical protein
MFVAGNTFTTAEIHPAVVEALDCVPEHYTLASLRDDLSKIRAKGLIAKLPNSPQAFSYQFHIRLTCRCRETR